jgi:hypothetical protein
MTTKKINQPKVEPDSKENNDFTDWLKELYDTERMTMSDLNDIYESIKYKGFDRMEVLKALFVKCPDPKLASELIMLCATQGPRRAANTRLTNGKTPAQMGILASDMKGQQGISCARVTAATADLAAYYLKKVQVPKRMLVECPAWLQFPSAGAIQMPEPYRTQHVEFSKKFSQAIGGDFNEQIYSQMIANSYLDPRLKLFE